MASSSEASCISDPNFAVICAFLERFAKACGITYPAFIDLQEMLENVEQVPQELIDLHIKLLRKARKTVFIEKWERALIKFCHTYSSQDGWEIERFGYKKSRLEVKLRVLKTLLEGQFDLNSKFKASVNEISSEELRSKPIGKDKSGRTYWVQFDPSSNIRVYREDLDEESWTLVAKDRISLVQLLQELSGNKIPLDINLLNEDSTSLGIEKLILDTGQSSNSSVKNDEINSEENSLKNGNGSGPSGSDNEKHPLKTEEPVNANENLANQESINGNTNGAESESDKLNDKEKTEEIKTSGKHSQIAESHQPNKKVKLESEVVNKVPESLGINVEESKGDSSLKEEVVSAAVEEPVMIVRGEGSGAECNTGNPDREKESSAEGSGSDSGNKTTDTEIVIQKEQDTVTEISDVKRSETDPKPAPKLWSIDTICGTGAKSNTELNDEGSVEEEDKVKKSFSSFSIDSVLEKKVDKHFLGSSVIENLQIKGGFTRPSEYVSETINYNVKASDKEVQLPNVNSTDLSTVSKEEPAKLVISDKPDKHEMECRDKNSVENNEESNLAVNENTETNASPDISVNPDADTKTETTSKLSDEGEKEIKSKANEDGSANCADIRIDNAESTPAEKKADADLKDDFDDQSLTDVKHSSSKDNEESNTDIPKVDVENESNLTLRMQVTSDSEMKTEVIGTEEEEASAIDKCKGDSCVDNAENERSVQSKYALGDKSNQEQETEKELEVHLEETKPLTNTLDVKEESVMDMNKEKTVNSNSCPQNIEAVSNVNIVEPKNDESLVATKIEDCSEIDLSKDSELNLKERGQEDKSELELRGEGKEDLTTECNKNDSAIEIEIKTEKEKETEKDNELQENSKESTDLDGVDRVIHPEEEEVCKVEDDSRKPEVVEVVETSKQLDDVKEEDSSRTTCDVKVEDDPRKPIDTVVHPEEQEVCKVEDDSRKPEVEVIETSSKLDDVKEEEDSSKTTCDVKVVDDSRKPEIVEVSETSKKSDNVKEEEDSSKTTCDVKAEDVTKKPEHVEVQDASKKSDDVKEEEDSSKATCDVKVGDDSRKPEVVEVIKTSKKLDKVKEDEDSSKTTLDVKAEDVTKKAEHVEVQEALKESHSVETEADSSRTTCDVNVEGDSRKPEIVEVVDTSKKSDNVKEEEDSSKTTCDVKAEDVTKKAEHVEDQEASKESHSVETEVDSLRTTCDVNVEGDSRKPEVVEGVDTSKKSDNVKEEEDSSKTTCDVKAEDVTKKAEQVEVQVASKESHGVETEEDSSKTGYDTKVEESSKEKRGDVEAEKDERTIGNFEVDDVEVAAPKQTDYVKEEDDYLNKADAAGIAKEDKGDEDDCKGAQPGERKQIDAAQGKETKLESENVNQCQIAVETERGDICEVKKEDSADLSKDAVAMEVDTSKEVKTEESVEETNVGNAKTNKKKKKETVVPQRILLRNRTKSSEKSIDKESSIEENKSTVSKKKGKGKSPAKETKKDLNEADAEEDEESYAPAAEEEEEEEAAEDDDDNDDTEREETDDEEREAGAAGKEKIEPKKRKSLKSKKNKEKKRQVAVEVDSENEDEGADAEDDPLEETDPLAIDNSEDTTEQKGTPKKSRKRRSCNANSDDGSNNQDAVGGKRIKMRGKKMLSPSIKKRAEEKREVRESSSEEEEEDEKKGNKEKVAERDNSSEEKDGEEKKSKKKGRPRKSDEQKSPGSRPVASREMKLLGITGIIDEVPSVRQSRRIAQIKLKEEAERRRAEELQLESYKKKDKDKKKKSDKKKKKADSDDEDMEEDADSDDKVKEKSPKKKKKDKLNFDELKPWQSTSGSSSSEDEEDEMDEEGHEDEELVFKSDHEFSPESDVEDPDYKPIKRARTAKVDAKDTAEAGAYDDTSCEKCARNDHPEWILLCDKCDRGWHASCLRPALMVVPEGDWFCPPCEHASLIVRLQESLVKYDRCQKQRENEELRRKRLAFVGINLDNVLPLNKKEKKGKDEDEKEGEHESGSRSSSSASGSSGSGSSGSSSDESEPVYQLRERRTNVTSYRYSEYDELIKSALQDEMEAVQGAGNAGKGKDINNIVNAEKEETETQNDVDPIAVDAADDKGEISNVVANENQPKKSKGKKDNDEDYENETEDDGNDGAEKDEEDEDEEDEEGEEELPPVVPRYDKKSRKKSRKITSLDFTSEEEDHNSDSDFKGASSEEESEYSIPSESESSDGVRKKRRGFDGPLRRSTRARIARYDREFINDDSDDDTPRRKKSRNVWASSESSDSDRSWGRRKKKANRAPRKPSGSRRKSKGRSKKKKNKKRVVDSDNEDVEKAPKKPKNRKIKYGGLDSLDEERVLTRRTRGKKINYQEDNASDSEEEVRKRKAGGLRLVDSDDEFNAEEEEKEEGEKELSEEETDDDFEDDDSYGDEDDEEKAKRKAKKKEENGKSKDKVRSSSDNKQKTKKRSVIPDPDDFSEDDLMEDEELDEFELELNDLDEEDQEILRKMLQEGDVPVHELKSAVKKAKEGKKLRRQKVDDAASNTTGDTTNESHTESSLTVPPILAHLENPPAGPKFHKIGKMKITPSRSEIKASILAGQSPESLGINPSNPLYKEIAGSSGPFSPEYLKNIRNNPELIGRMDTSNPSGLLLKTLQGELPKGNEPGIPLSNANIPLQNPVKEDTQQLPPGYPPPYLNQSLTLNSQPGILNHCPPQFNNFPGVMPPTMPQFPPNLPTTVAGLSTLEAQQRRKPGPKPGTKNKRKAEDSMSPSNESDDSTENPIQNQSDEFIKAQGVQESPKRKGRGRGKKQLLAEAQAQAKQDVTIATVQAPTQFPPQGLVPEGGSVITRMLNTPQGPQAFPPGDPALFARARPPFRPTAPLHFPGPGRAPAGVPAIRLRPPPPGSIYHTTNPLDPSPSGGGAININVPNPPGPHHITKPSPSNFNRAPPPVQTIPPMIPRFPADPNLRPPFPSHESPPRTENFQAFQNFYGNFPQQPPITGSEESLPSSTFQSSPYTDHFDESQVSEASNSKPFDEETGGEFGGLASYFASQREDDLDT